MNNTTVVAGMSVNLTKLDCPWCDPGVKAPHRITEDGWTYEACDVHARYWWPALMDA